MRITLFMEHYAINILKTHLCTNLVVGLTREIGGEGVEGDYFGARIRKSYLFARIYHQNPQNQSKILSNKI